ncbi:MAG: type IV pilus twitching motility protein PilT [Planctomycetota bacterium]
MGIPEDEFSFRDVADALKSNASNAAASSAGERPASKSDSTAPAASDGSTPAAPTTLSPRHQLEAWLALMVKAGASDLILRAGGRPSHRTDGKIGFFAGRVPTAGALLEVLEGIMGRERMEIWRANGSADAALHLDGLGRFRMNAYKQMGDPAVVLRRIREHAPSIDTLDLPAENLKKLAMRKRGLILVTGIAGSGKSTTLASMIQHMNETVERHVVTLEDPVELLFSEKNCVISQREVGTDCTSFKDGLRHALRQSPDVILIGEMRDAETVSSALDATETGHLVLSTLHTVNAAQTVERILSFFSANQHSQVRQRMADNLAGVLSQRLVTRAGGKGMVPAFELMISTPHIRELLQEGKTAEMARVIEQGTERGLISFNMCLRRLVQEHKVELNDALAASDRPEELVLALRGITGSSGRPESAPQNPKSHPGPDGLRLAKRE